jgi:hypothetical protein
MDGIVQVSDRDFRYERGDAKIAEMLRRTAKQVAREVGHQSSSVLRVGQLLIDVKGRIEHGLFTRYVENELGFTLRTAENYMRAAGLLAETKPEMVSRLPPAALYLLAAPSMPADTRARVLTALAAEDADIRAIEADVRSARRRASKPAPVAEDSAARRHPALQKIADLLRLNLPPDAYLQCCDLIEAISGQNGILTRDLWKALAERAPQR